MHLVLDHPITCIVGASGSGKTTLLRHLNKLYVPDTGEIVYNSAPLSSIDPVELRRRVVLLGQTPIIYDGTVGDNLKAGLIYCIPISGMIVGNAMTGIALGANKLCSGMYEGREKIENSLMLGATPAAAARAIVNDAFDSAILPTMNNMLTMGIVSLPGMMTGQILSGTFPITAIKYQIGIMLAILGCTALTVVLFVTLGYKTFFTKHAALKDIEH